MSDERSRLREALERLAREDLERHGNDHPDADVLFAFATGELPEASAAALREHLAICRECTRLVLAVPVLLGEPPPEGVEVPAEPEVTASWERFRARAAAPEASSSEARTARSPAASGEREEPPASQRPAGGGGNGDGNGGGGAASPERLSGRRLQAAADAGREGGDREAGWPARPGPMPPPSPMPPRGGWTSPRTLWASAIGLLGGLALGILLTHSPQPGPPRIEGPVAAPKVLLGEENASPRGPRIEIDLEAAAVVVPLELRTASDSRPYPAWRVDIQPESANAGGPRPAPPAVHHPAVTSYLPPRHLLLVFGYRQLPAGDYRLRVLGCDQAGSCVPIEECALHVSGC